jgi:hypothetical protein
LISSSSSARRCRIRRSSLDGRLRRRCRGWHLARLRSRTNALTVRVHAQSEPDVTELVPSDAFPHGLAALERLVHEADSVSAAVAFVTDSGVSALRELLDGRADIELVVRAGGITSPAAVLALRND